MSSQSLLYVEQTGDLALVIRTLERTRFQSVIAAPMVRAQKAAVVLVKNAARRELGSHRRTGKMRSRIRTRYQGSGLRFVAGVKSTGVGSNLIAGGVRPHAIAPGRVMPMWGGRGAWKKGAGLGITGFARKVEHPGFPADPFFERAIDSTQGEVQALIQQAADGMVRDLAAAMGG